MRKLVPTLALLAACADAEPPALTVGSVGYSEDQLLGLSDSRRDALVGITALGLAVADSTTADLGTQQIDAWADDVLLDILAADLTLEKNGVGDDQLRARYAAEPEWELTVRHLLVFSDRGLPEAEREAARALAARGLGMLQAGSDFPEVEAALTTEGGLLVREGTMPPARDGAFVPEFWGAALALRPGGLSPVTETQYGFHVLRLLDRTEVPFDEARSSVARRVARTFESPRAVYEAWGVGRGDDDASRRLAALQEARARGLSVPASDRLELVRRWETDVLSWSTALGFTYGLAPEQVGQVALAALAKPGQTADIARRELATHAELLRHAYPVTLGTPRAARP